MSVIGGRGSFPLGIADRGSHHHNSSSMYERLCAGYSSVSLAIDLN
jgi:hypothetical protein